MKLSRDGFLAFAIFIAIVAQTPYAHAQALRTWVSGVGDDANPCSRTAPCKTFAGAISKTAANGVIDVLDPGGFGAVTITKGITIRDSGHGGGILSSGTNGINVNAPNAAVNLIGLNIDGAGAGFVGINIINAAAVNIVKCTIVNHLSGSATGIRLSSAAITRVVVTDSNILSNGTGIDVAPLSGATLALVLDNARINSNTIANIKADQSTASVILRRSTILGGVITITNGAILRSFGDNAIAGGTPNQTTPLQ